MKNNSLTLLLGLALMLAMPLTVTAAEVAKPMKSSTESARAVVLIERLEEIKEMDKSIMSREEKKATRKEVNAIKKEMKQLGGGVYLSAGAVIIIILLLILLL